MKRRWKSGSTLVEKLFDNVEKYKKIEIECCKTCKEILKNEKDVDELYNATSGSSGLVCAIMYLVGGIVSIASRNAKGIGGSVACVILYLFGFLVAMPGADTYGDLSVWGGLCVILAIFHLVCAVKTKKRA